MILWRTALKNFWRTAAMSIMTILQTTATLVITAVMVSALSIAFHYYTPFQDYFEGNGLFVIFGYPGANSDGNTLQSDEELMAQLDGSAESIIACHRPIVNQGRCVSYDDDVISCYQPYLSAGRWLDPDADELEVVVSENDNGWKVGDLIEVEMASKDGGVFTAQTAKVVGILEEGARAVGSKTSAEIMQLFHSLHEAGNTVVIVTHDPNIAEQCERVIHIEDGNIVE